MISEIQVSFFEVSEIETTIQIYFDLFMFFIPLKA